MIAYKNGKVDRESRAKNKDGIPLAWYWDVSFNELADEIDRLSAALATARADALHEGARILRLTAQFCSSRESVRVYERSADLLEDIIDRPLPDRALQEIGP